MANYFDDRLVVSVVFLSKMKECFFFVNHHCKLNVFKFRTFQIRHLKASFWALKL